MSFRELEDSPAVRHFERVFQPIQGSRHRFTKLHGTDYWLRFVFKRWFLIAELVERLTVEAFWTFDSDTLVLAPLDPRQQRYADVVATTQCADRCLNGWIGSCGLVRDYTNFILNLFEDVSYLESQRERLKSHAGLAFTEMDAFTEFRKHQQIRTRHLVEPLEGEVFDDALAFPGGYEASKTKIAGNTVVKRLWSERGRGLYAQLVSPYPRLVRLLSCNMSWMPSYVWDKLIPFCLTPEQDADVKPPAGSELHEVDLSQPLTDKIATALKVKAFEVKRALGR